jgi:hypothetical protein
VTHSRIKVARAAIAASFFIGKFEAEALKVEEEIHAHMHCDFVGTCSYVPTRALTISVH